MAKSSFKLEHPLGSSIFPMPRLICTFVWIWFDMWWFVTCNSLQSVQLLAIYGQCFASMTIILKGREWFAWSPLVISVHKLLQLQVKFCRVWASLQGGCDYLRLLCLVWIIGLIIVIHASLRLAKFPAFCFCFFTNFFSSFAYIVLNHIAPNWYLCKALIGLSLCGNLCLSSSLYCWGPSGQFDVLMSLML
jgi:hypothetical protein